jgi:cytochrome c biogenesis protein CcdA
MIFLVYFAIGLGILRAVRLSNDPHFVARAGSWILIGLGVINLIEYFYPRFPIKLHMPRIAGQKTNELLKQATVPATVGVGILVGLCTFPCSGGVYVSIITLLNAKTTLGWGISYLALYNVLFVLPLLVILIGAGNRLVAKRWARWERENSKNIRLWYGIIMVGLGVLMLLWVI